MAAELLVIGNPSRKARRARKSRVRRNPARRPMSAKQAKYFGKRRAKRAGKRRARAVTLARNPSRRRSLRRRALRRNPMTLGGFKPESFVKNTLMPAGVGAAGALALDVALGYAAPHLPAVMTTGTIAPTLTRIAGAVGLGMVTQMVTKDRHMSEQVAAGAIIVTLYAAAKTMVKQQFPTLPLAGVGGMGMYVPGMGYAGAAMAYPDSLSMYVPGGNNSVMPPAVAAAIAQNVARSKNQPPVGLHGGGFSEGDYNY